MFIVFTEFDRMSNTVATAEIEYLDELLFEAETVASHAVHGDVVNEDMIEEFMDDVYDINHDHVNAVAELLRSIASGETSFDEAGMFYNSEEGAVGVADTLDGAKIAFVNAMLDCS